MKSKSKHIFAALLGISFLGFAQGNLLSFDGDIINDMAVRLTWVTPAEADNDYFTIEKIYLKNYGVDDRSVKQFQVEVKTKDNANWTKLEVPGSKAGEADYNFIQASQGGPARLRLPGGSQ